MLTEKAQLLIITAKQSVLKVIYCVVRLWKKVCHICKNMAIETF